MKRANSVDRERVRWSVRKREELRRGGGYQSCILSKPPRSQDQGTGRARIEFQKRKEEIKVDKQGGGRRNVLVLYSSTLSIMS